MIRKLTAALFVAVLSFTAFTAAPVVAKPEAPQVTAAPDVEQRFERPDGVIYSQTAIDQCKWRQAATGLTSYTGSVRYFHYGTAHVTQCWWWQVYGQHGSYIICDQYVWNIANPTWDRYRTGYYPNTVCW